MLSINSKSSIFVTVIGIALALVAGVAFADKPSWASEGKHKERKSHHEKRERGDYERDDDHGSSAVFSFGINDRRIISDYYGSQVRKGKCPPGLAKKNYDCLPPGQAKKWQKGRQLAKDIRYYELPRELRMRLPAPPPNYRYVRVADDILMITQGSRMVIDAIEDILY